MRDTVQSAHSTIYQGVRVHTCARVAWGGTLIVVHVITYISDYLADI
jgi:hypothetical protein